MPRPPHARRRGHVRGTRRAAPIAAARSLPPGRLNGRPNIPPHEVAAPDVDARDGAPAQISAAVLVPLFLDAERRAHAVFTRRRHDLRRHAGEISFPGGRRDPDDADLRETALREAEEEIGLPRADVRVLGALSPTSTFVTGYLIHPFVGLIPAGLRWQLSPAEVDAVLELPLDALRAGRRRTRMERRGIEFETDAYMVDDHLIWGATARIVENLLARAKALLSL